MTTLGVLASYALERGPTNLDRFRRLTELGIPFVWDSGAFSVASGAATVDRDEHAEWVIEHQRPGVRFLALDVIGDPDATIANFARQRAVGAHVEPTVHYGDPVEQVDRILDIDATPEWVNLGGIVASLGSPTRHRNVASFVAAVRRRLPPETKVHALGCVHPPIARLAPFEGADSTYWLSVVRYRSLSLFDPATGGWRKFSAVCRSADDRRHHTWRVAHKRGAWLRDNYGITPAMLVDNHDNRNDPLLLAASVESHRRFAQWIAERHGIDATVYLAGAISAVRMHHLLAPYDVTTPSDSEERPT